MVFYPHTANSSLEQKLLVGSSYLASLFLKNGIFGGDTLLLHFSASLHGLSSANGLVGHVRPRGGLKARVHPSSSLPPSWSSGSQPGQRWELQAEDKAAAREKEPGAQQPHAATCQPGAVNVCTMSVREAHFSMFKACYFVFSVIRN